jgi:hypothetical protein
MTSEFRPEPELYRAVIGERQQDYYLGYARRAIQRGYTPLSWHWPAMIFGLLWLMYRKQYRWALIYFGISWLAMLLGAATEQVAPGLGTAVWLTTSIGFQYVWFPLNANAIYFRWAQSQVQMAREYHPGNPPTQQAWLAQRGGVNVAAPWILIGCFFLLLAFFGPPPE